MSAAAKTEWKKILSKHLSLCLPLNSLAIGVDLTTISPNIKLPFHGIAVCSPLQGEVTWCFAVSPLESCKGHIHTQPGSPSQVPHTRQGQREVPLPSLWLCPVQSQPGMALTDVSSCSQQCPRLGGFSPSCAVTSPAVLSPLCAGFTWPTAPKLPIPREHTKSRKKKTENSSICLKHDRPFAT